MKKVYGQPFICLDEFIDVKSLCKLVPKINFGLAKAHQYIRANFATTYQNVQNGVDKKSPKDFATAFSAWKASSPTSEELEFLKTDPRGFEYWLSYEYNVVDIMNYLVLREPDLEFGQSYSPLDALKDTKVEFIWSDESQFFPELCEWISDLPFQELGSVCLLLKMPGEATPCHRDLFYGVDDYDHEENFIWLDPLHSRQMFVLDKAKNKKYEMRNGVSFYWNNHDFHGGIDTTVSRSWAIRIECKFNNWLHQQLCRY